MFCIKNVLIIFCFFKKLCAFIIFTKIKHNRLYFTHRDTISIDTNLSKGYDYRCCENHMFITGGNLNAEQ